MTHAGRAWVGDKVVGYDRAADLALACGHKQISSGHVGDLLHAGTMR
jgi:hypothetical protein